MWISVGSNRSEDAARSAIPTRTRYLQRGVGRKRRHLATLWVRSESNSSDDPKEALINVMPAKAGMATPRYHGVALVS